MHDVFYEKNMNQVSSRSLEYFDCSGRTGRFKRVSTADGVPATHWSPPTRSSFVALNYNTEIRKT
jgi:hypothetical protein